MKPNVIVVFQILNSELTGTFSPLIRETDRGGKMVFIREGLITKRLENLETIK